MTASSGRSNIIDIACVIIHETELAWLIDAGDEAPVWIPKSIGEWDPTDSTMAMPERWAHDKGLI